MGAGQDTQIVVDYAGADGVSTGNGQPGGDYVVNSSADLQPTTPSATQQAAILVRLRGGHGSKDTSNDATAGGAGGTISITNQGKLTVGTTPTTHADGAAPGIWDDTGSQFGIYGASLGGAGADADSTVVGGGNGGAGGAGDHVYITNYGAVNLTAAPYGGVGLYGVSVGGPGGKEDPAASGDQDGGNGAGAGVVSITNSGSITLQAGSVSRYAWGIGIETMGGLGGTDNGAGGSGGKAYAYNYGSILVDVGGSNNVASGVRGIYVSSQGGDGRTSSDPSDNGGDGGGYSELLVENHGKITVNATGLGAPSGLLGLSGGIVSIGRGANGGAGPQNFDSGHAGGLGGTTATTKSISLFDGSDIQTSGNYLPGVLSVAVGGNGGMGREDSDGSNGGVGGTIVINTSGNSRISTDGTMSHGIVARSVGGGGGGVQPSSGIADFSAENSGVGGAGGAVTITLGDGGSITTTGTNAIGVLGQSMGGYGGSASDNFELFGNVGANAGNGGSPGHVTLVNSGGITTSGLAAHGMVAQSIGGGGGTAGQSSGIVALGGDGGSAVGGGQVDVTNSGSLRTNGQSAIGMLAQSIGGGGGDGGGASGMGSIGGQGGDGGWGGTSNATLSGGTLTTAGDHAYGVVAQAIGGGGGTGGAAASYGAGPGFAMSVAVGGKGGGGGGGGTASATLTGATITTGTAGTTAGDAHAVVVQSIGGGGGMGGSSAATSYALAVPVGDTSVGAALSFAMGGTGGSGGAGGQAVATLTGSGITTYGAGSYGALVQSIGGGGGTGGSASSAATVLGTGSSAAATASLALGGTGSNGAAGGSATLKLQGNSTIATWGESANAVMVQSIGGGGGAGGLGSASADSRQTDASVSFTLALGKSGGGGGAGNTVEFDSTMSDRIATAGDGARGVLLQSIGGGGGTAQGGQAGLALSGSPQDSEVDVDTHVYLGGNGASGGAGGAITFSADGNIATYGADADGFLAQSIGGAGGLGGAAGGSSADASTGVLRRLAGSLRDDSTSYALTLAVGGSGGNGGAGGAIGTSSKPVDLAAIIRTYGDYADAAVLQSIGGGGGQGGAATVAASSATAQLSLSVGGSGGSGGKGGDINAFIDGYNDNDGFYTQGFGAHGIVMQSIGGGGGMGASGSPRTTGSIHVGSTGGSGGDGGNITVVNSLANIGTTGDSAHGMVVQSIGAGGGIGMAGSTDSAAGSGGHQLSLHLGGASGIHGNGGAIRIESGFGVTTYGHRALGIVAQSIGGGGGIATTGSSSGLTGAFVGGGTGNGGQVSVSVNYGNGVSTHGDGSHAIVAQSIGGGGGILGDTALGVQLDPAAAGIGSNTQAGGGSSAVNVTASAPIATAGRNAFGIIAQSIGGGGGLGGYNGTGFAGKASTSGGISGAVTVTQSSTISSSGEGSTGIFAQSLGWEDNAVVTVNVNGTVQGGSGSNGNGVWVANGKHNVLNVAKGAQLGAQSGTAVRYSGEDDDAFGSRLTVNTAGLVSGNILCQNTSGNSACDVNIQASATMTSANVYEANVANEGLVLVGRPRGFETLLITGRFSQAGTGVLRNDVDFDRMRSSRLVVQGDAALGGMLEPMPTALLPGRELPVLTVQGATQGALQAKDSPVIDYGIRRSGQDHLVQAQAADFDAPSMGLAGNERDAARNLQGIWNAGGNAALAPLFAQLDLASRDGARAYRSRVNDLLPGAALAPAAQSMAGMTQFTGNMMSCPAYTGADALTGERDCSWGLVTRRTTHQDADNGGAGFGYDTTSYQFGGQRQVGPGWFLGGSMAYQNSRLDGDSRVRGSGDSGYAGVVLKREAGPWTFSGAVGGGYGSYDLKRGIAIPGYEASLKSTPDVYSAGVRLRAARTFATEKAYVKPYVDLDATYTRMPGHRESGDHALGLTVDSSDKFLMALSPMVEIGGRAKLPDGSDVRPFAYVGASFLSGDNWAVNARLRGAPSGTGTFRNEMPIDDVTGRVGAGLQVTSRKGVDFRLQYDGEFSRRADSHSASLKVMVPF
ncbi:autotransporter outer membrane beta-barrel domain-containing protein [Bordetella genomosp. 13]|uniref:autotransporter outer membrane beta-barrel domain-containing protein n=1 Tax=Bordetella genomosp. 13 TaxID=463040 RepID=UPI0011AA5C71|nr:autotransporter outer membrane beta-barrel domain-containing protein [Bordetella genomosp. 13]